MKVLCGTDIIEIERVKEAIEKLEDNFLNRVFTKKEIEYCKSKKKQKYQHYAGRFAAKEAIFKAVSELLNNKYEINWKDIEIINNENSKPQANLKLKLQSIQNIDISISHCKQYATAIAVILINN